METLAQNGSAKTALDFMQSEDNVKFSYFPCCLISGPFLNDASQRQVRYVKNLSAQKKTSTAESKKS